MAWALGALGATLPSLGIVVSDVAGHTIPLDVGAELGVGAARTHGGRNIFAPTFAVGGALR